jgi:tetratricopeptide (TPR) repeat protein
MLWPNSADGSNLRNELSVLKRCLNSDACSPLLVSKSTVKLDHNAVSIDVFDDPSPLKRLQLAEGLDVGNVEFEEWLTTERTYWNEHTVSPANVVPQPSSELDTRSPTLIVEPFTSEPHAVRTQLHAAALREELFATLDLLGGLLNLRTETPSKIDKLCYRVSGSVREEAGTGTLRYIIRVSSALERTSIWTERFTVPLDSNFETQELIIRRILETFQQKITDGAWSNIWRDKSTNLTAWELYQKGRDHESLFKKAETDIAIGCYRDALKLDENFWPARIAVGFCLCDRVRLGWTSATQREMGKISDLVSEVLKQQPDNFYALALRAFMIFINGEKDEGLALLKKVVAANPLSPELSAYLGAMYGHSGLITDEIRQYELALRLTRHPPAWIISNLAIAQATLGNPDALETAQKALSRDKNNVRARVAKVTALIDKKATEFARTVANEILELEPSFTAENWSQKDCFTIEENHSYIRTRLEVAGL